MVYNLILFYFVGCFISYFTEKLCAKYITPKEYDIPKEYVIPKERDYLHIIFVFLLSWVGVIIIIWLLIFELGSRINKIKPPDWL